MSKEKQSKICVDSDFLWEVQDYLVTLIAIVETVKAMYNCDMYKHIHGLEKTNDKLISILENDDEDTDDE